MALLRIRTSQQRIYLAERSHVGRSAKSWIILDDPSVSQDHAVLFFHPDGWAVRDLGSTNGSRLNNQTLEAGKTVVLSRGSELHFGNDIVTLDSIEPPTACAQSLTTRNYYAAVNGVMTLPGELDSLLTVYQSEDDTWLLEKDGESQPIADGDVLYAGDQRFRIHIPSTASGGINLSTHEGRAPLLRSHIKLVFRVSADEESVLVELHAGRRVVPVPPRSFHDVLLELARARLRDKNNGVAEEECGWVYADELAHRLGHERTRLNVAIHRVRRQLAEVGVNDAAQLFERRPTSHQLRLGVRRLSVESNRA